ncbi:MAG: hypothetical protein F9K46_04120 [Anaerolineae bacterium]|nr:MAG: hypothetical protein F9K46_04120 [Anaerolineae bacterium]
MTWPLHNQFQAAIQVTGILVEELSPDESRALRKRVSVIYSKETTSLFLWEYFSDCALITNVDAWRWISEYIGNKSCLLFFFEHLAPPVFQLNNGFDAVALVGELPMDEFYVTNTETSYLLCFSHHDILYALGDAKTWLERKLSEIQR